MSAEMSIAEWFRQLDADESAPDGWMYNDHADKTQVPLGNDLLNACAYGDISIVKILVEEHGCDVNEGNGYTTPIELAVGRNDLEMVEYLLSRGAIVEWVYDVWNSVYPSAEERNTRTQMIQLLRAQLPAGA